VSESGFAVDMHVKLLDERVAERAKRRGIDALVYAPHFRRLPEIREQARRYTDDELLVVPARELFTGNWRERRHVLALGLSEPIPDFITLEGAMAELDRQDAVVCAPHPEFFSVSLSEEDIRRYHDLIDAVEVYNPKHWKRHNRRAQDIATRLDIPGFGSSYAHLRGTVGEVWTRFHEPFSDEAELLAALSGRTPRQIVHRGGVRHRLRRGIEFSHLGWENSWGKVDRLLLSGTEPTHPSQIAYDGRFDDVAVY